MNYFNLITEKWIPSNKGNVSIEDCFVNETITFIGENARETISLFKFLSAIGTAATMFKTNEEQKNCSFKSFKENVKDYLYRNYNDFYMYGERPFLQFTKLKEYNKDEFVCTKCLKNLIPTLLNNNPIMLYDHQNYSNSDELKAKLLVLELGFCGNSKDAFSSALKIVKFSTNENYVKYAKHDENGSLERGVNSCLGLFAGNKGTNNGMMHGFIFKKSICESIFINLINEEFLNDELSFNTIKSIGIPPWKYGNFTEDCEYKNTYFGTLIPMNRFMLFDKDSEELYYTEGIRNTDGIINGALQQDSIFNYTYEVKDSDAGKTLYNTSVKPEYITQPFEALGVALVNNNHDSYALKKFNKVCDLLEDTDNAYIWVGGVEYNDKDSKASGLRYYVNYIESYLPFEKSNLFSNNFGVFIKNINSFNSYANEIEKAIYKYYKGLELKNILKNIFNNNFKTDIYTFLNSKYNEIFNNIENNLSQEKIENDITKFFKAEYSKFCNQVNSKEHFEIFYKFYPKIIFKF